MSVQRRPAPKRQRAPTHRHDHLYVKTPIFEGTGDGRTTVICLSVLAALAILAIVIVNLLH